MERGKKEEKKLKSGMDSWKVKIQNQTHEGAEGDIKPKKKKKVKKRCQRVWVDKNGKEEAKKAHLSATSDQQHSGD